MLRRKPGGPIWQLIGMNRVMSEGVDALASFVFFPGVISAYPFATDPHLGRNGKEGVGSLRQLSGSHLAV